MVRVAWHTFPPYRSVKDFAALRDFQKNATASPLEPRTPKPSRFDNCLEFGFFTFAP